MPTNLENDENHKQKRIFNNATLEMALLNIKNTPGVSAISLDLN